MSYKEGPIEKRLAAVEQYAFRHAMFNFYPHHDLWLTFRDTVVVSSWLLLARAAGYTRRRIKDYRYTRTQHI